MILGDWGDLYKSFERIGGIMAETRVTIADEIPFEKLDVHRDVYGKDIVSPADAALSGIGVSKIMYEKIKPHGQVLPHIHDVGEIIYIVKGTVALLMNGEWKQFGAGSTFIVPAGIRHSVENISDTDESEQVSMFIPMSPDIAMVTTIDDEYLK